MQNIDLKDKAQQDETQRLLARSQEIKERSKITSEKLSELQAKGDELKSGQQTSNFEAK